MTDFDQNKTASSLVHDQKNTNEIVQLLTNVLTAVCKSETDTSSERKKLCEEYLKLASEKTILEYSSYAKHSDYEKASKLSRKLNTLVKEIQKNAMEHTDFYLYMMGFYAATFHAYKNSVKHQNEESIFTVGMAKIINQKHVKEVLKYLYTHDYTQNKTLCEVISVKPNLLHKIIEPLIDIECVSRFPYGKCTFYSLSEQGKKYVKNILGYKERPAIEPEYFSHTSYSNPKQLTYHYHYTSSYTEWNHMASLYPKTTIQPTTIKSTLKGPDLCKN